jgi:hypothetical protein
MPIPLITDTPLPTRPFSVQQVVESGELRSRMEWRFGAIVMSFERFGFSRDPDAPNQVLQHSVRGMDL